MLKVSTGNGIWCCIMALMAVLTWSMYRGLKDRTARQQRKALLISGFVIFALYFLQRFFMFRDPVFWELYGADNHPVLVNALPLHLCYSGLMVTMVGLYKGYGPLLSFGFYAGLLGAFLAMASPDGYYEGRSLLHVPTLLFYMTHVLLVAAYACIGLLGLFRPGRRAAGNALAVLILLTLVLHGVNLTGAALGLESMNYCYTVSPGGSGLLELLWSWLPCQWAYVVLPGSLAFCFWAAGLNLLLKKRKNQPAANR